MDKSIRNIIYIVLVIIIIVICKKIIDEYRNKKLEIEYFTDKKPNIVIIIGDNINTINISKYSDGILGYKTPNIDSIGSIKCVDVYGEMNSENGLLALLTGQMPNRTRMDNDYLTIADILNSNGYATGYFGKTYIDQKQMQECGFKEALIYNNDEMIYMRCEKNDCQVKKLEKGIYDKTVKEMNDYIFDNMESYIKKTDKPFLLIYNTIFQSSDEQHNENVIAHDKYVGKLLDKLNDNTIIIYTGLTGNNNIQTNYKINEEFCTDGNYRIPLLIKPLYCKDKTINQLISITDIFPTIAHKLGYGNIKDKLENGYNINNKVYHVKIDGVIFDNEHNRKHFIYNSKNGHIVGIRINNYKLIFALCQDKPNLLNVPIINDLSTNHYENNIIDAELYDKILINQKFLIEPAKNIIKDLLSTFDNDDNVNILLDRMNNYNIY